jgi:hypothetical protein
MNAIFDFLLKHMTEYALITGTVFGWFLYSWWYGGVDED